MQIGADHVPVPGSLVTVPAVVPVAVQNPAEWPRPRPQMCAPSVILKSRQHAGIARRELDRDRDVPDQPRAVGAHRTQVEQADSGEGLIAELVAVAEQLIAAAHAEQHRAPRGGRVERLPLVRHQIQRTTLLVAVLPPADVVEVGAVGIKRVADRHARQFEAEPAPSAAALQHQEVAAVGVDVHHVRIQRTGAKCDHVRSN